VVGHHAASLLELLGFNNPREVANCTQPAFTGKLNFLRYAFPLSKVPETNTVDYRC
jgi:hypothetical protein